MKSKRRTVNVDKKECNKKIMTRNMQHKIIEDKMLSNTTNCHNHIMKKSSPKTRAKTSSVNKDSDPYSFSKMDEECKIPMKKIKLTEKTGKDVSVNTCTFSTMTDPELLGPCEPGTSIELQGIVWMETSTGLLVINVTWRGRTYVGTLLDSTKYEFTPSFNFHEFSQKFETRLTTRPNRGKKTLITPETNCHTGLRSNNIRHSRRLGESLSYSNNIKKCSARLANNASCYIDTLSLSADPSLSGESDTDLNPYQKYSPTSKTRSITRSLAKQNNVMFSDSVSSETENNLLKCSQQTCFKKFSDITALRYHLQLTHHIFEEEIKIDDKKHDKNNITEDIIKKEEINIEHKDIIETHKTINGKINRDNEHFEFNSESELERYDEKTNHNTNLLKNETIIVDKDSEEYRQNKIIETSNNLLNILENNFDSCGQSCSLKIATLDPKEKVSNASCLTIKNHSPKQTILNNPKLVSNSNLDTTSHTNTLIRTVTARTVSIPFESTTSVTNSNLLPIPSISQTIIESKSDQITLNSSHISQSRKMKSSKSHNSNCINSFQIPSSTTLSKKRPLIPLKVSVNQTVFSSPSRLLNSTKNLNVISPNHSTHHIRCSTFSSVTPILPAISSSNTATSAISVVSSGPCTINSTFHYNPINTKRTIVTSSNVSPSGMNSLLSLKPIQPKPKLTSNSAVTSNAISSSLISSVSTTNIPGLLSSQTSYQRQILPSPVSKNENGSNSDDKLIHKVDNIKTVSMKKKRRKPDKKLKISFHECNRLKPFPLNPIQPKRKKEYKDFILQQNDISLSVDNYKMDEENSHSPEYSDLSETNDTPAPILEKEVELKSGDCDKLIICTDFEPTSTNRIRSSCSDNSPYNKPPALMPAVLSTDILNGSTNDLDLSDTPVKTGRRKLQTLKKPIISNELTKDLLQCSNEPDFPTSLRHNNTNTSSRKSFQSSSFEDQLSPSLFSSSKMSLYNSSQNDFHEFDQNSKIRIPNKSSNLSAINDYVWMTKNNQDFKSKNFGKIEDNYPSKISTDVDSIKKKCIVPHSQQSNGRFSVQALTSSQEIVSRSLTTSSTVIAVNPNTKSANTLFKN